MLEVLWRESFELDLNDSAVAMLERDLDMYVRRRDKWSPLAAFAHRVFEFDDETADATVLWARLGANPLTITFALATSILTDADWSEEVRAEVIATVRAYISRAANAEVLRSWVVEFALSGEGHYAALREVNRVGLPAVDADDLQQEWLFRLIARTGRKDLPSSLPADEAGARKYALMLLRATAVDSFRHSPRVASVSLESLLQDADSDLDSEFDVAQGLAQLVADRWSVPGPDETVESLDFEEAVRRLADRTGFSGVDRDVVATVAIELVRSAAFVDLALLDATIARVLQLQSQASGRVLEHDSSRARRVRVRIRTAVRTLLFEALGAANSD